MNQMKKLSLFSKTRSSFHANSPFFGTSLEKQIAFDAQRKPTDAQKIQINSESVPYILQAFVHFLSEDHVLKTEGLFRTTASVKPVKQLKEDIDKCLIYH